MTLVFVRIGLRYLAGILVTKGLLAPELGDMITHDPDVATAVQVAAGGAVAVVAEGWYFLAHRFGWAK